MTKLALPTTRATTAYGYLSAIAKLVLEEPKRLNMGVVVLRGEGLERYIAGRWDSEQPLKHRPSCGTVGCVAGWAMTLANRTSKNEENRGSMWEARDLLGLTQDQSEELFVPDNLVHAHNRQTAAHARATVKHIERFQAKYAVQLKATKVVKGFAPAGM